MLNPGQVGGQEYPAIVAAKTQMSACSPPMPAQSCLIQYTALLSLSPVARFRAALV